MPVADRSRGTTLLHNQVVITSRCTTETLQSRLRPWISRDGRATQTRPVVSSHPRRLRPEACLKLGRLPRVRSPDIAVMNGRVPCQNNRQSSPAVVVSIVSAHRLWCTHALYNVKFNRQFCAAEACDLRSKWNSSISRSTADSNPLCGAADRFEVLEIADRLGFVKGPHLARHLRPHNHTGPGDADMPAQTGGPCPFLALARMHAEQPAPKLGQRFEIHPLMLY